LQSQVSYGYWSAGRLIRYGSADKWGQMKVYNATSLITQNNIFRKILSDLQMVIDTNSSILLTGETGVGKEILAEYIHRNSNRNIQPFIKVGLSSIPSELLESELFGHEKGAFTGAAGEKKGLFELADRGSIFLDDIDDFPLPLQSKLLRVLESREIMRIGAEKSIQIDVRLITASKVDLKKLVETREFRADLFYRINVVPVSIPALRERIDDIPSLVEYFIKRYSGGKEISVEPEALDVLKNYQWPGNVRELKNVIHRTVLFCNSQIHAKDLPDEILSYSPVKTIVKSCIQCLVNQKISFRDVVSCLESNLIQQALNRYKGNKLSAAKLLNLPVSTLNDKIKKYRLEINKNYCRTEIVE
jgi:transcriptional regulator with GAF, ATPase, and Fis domain